MDKLDARIGALTEDKLLALVKKINTKKEVRLPKGKKTNRENGVLSFPQQRLWYLMQLDQENPFYNVPVTFRIHGAVDLPALERSINELVNRHEAFRTEFDSAGGIPFQRVRESAEITMAVIDLRGDKDDQEEKLFAELKKFARVPFNLEKAPLIRCAVILLGAQDMVLNLTMHHIISDGWSVGIFIEELGAAYKSICNREKPVFKGLSMSYGAFAAEQVSHYESGGLRAQLDYWKHILADYGSGPLPLPFDKKRPPIQQFNGARHIERLSRSLAISLEGIANEYGATLFMVLAACVYTALYRYTGQDKIRIGTPVANRQYPELEELIGFFVNTIVLQAEISPEMTFEELLEAVRSNSLDAFEHQNMPFEKIVEELHMPRDQSFNPLFQVMFILQNAPLPPLRLNDIPMSYMLLDIGITKFDLTYQLTNWSEGLEIDIEYNTDLFEPKTIQRMSGHLHTIMLAVAENPQQKISRLPMLSAAELKELDEWNQTEVDYGRFYPVHEMFMAQVQKTPDQTALFYQGETLTYRQLDDATTKLANYLMKLGVGPEVPVALMLERSLEMVIAIISIFKAGGAYLPIDPKDPIERRKFMLEDSSPLALLTQNRFTAGLSGTGIRIISLDAEWMEIEKESELLSSQMVSDRDMAYIIYTSGSTGKPKGVINEQRGLVNRINWMREKSGISHHDRVLQKTTYTFDVSVWEFLLPLVSGATLYILKPDGHKDSKYLMEYICQHNITIVHFVPSMLKLFLQEPGVENCRLKQVYCSGEVLSPDLAEAFYQRLKGNLINLYGPTEAAIDVTYWDCKPGSMTVPIGFPIANTRLYLLDSHFNRVPPGVLGELYIGGAGVARGYQNRAELTAKNFIPDIFTKVPGATLYKTGDLAKYGAFGAIEYCGRNDFQVKIRGVRIELGEVEAALALQPSIQDQIVVADHDTAGSSRLIAYCIPQKDGGLDFQNIREELKKILPEYAIPSLFIPIKELPLLPNGKVDQKALPLPDSSAFMKDRIIIPPRNEYERRLADIFKTLLNVGSISIDDSFFELGGHSLLAIQLITKVREAFQIDIPLRQLLSSPQISFLSECIEALTQQGQGSHTAFEEIIVDKKNVYEPFPLNDVQQAYWIGRNDAFELGNTSAHLYIEIQGPVLAPDRVENAVQRLIDRHHMLRAVVREDGRQQILKEVPPFKLPVMDLRDLNDDDRALRLDAIRSQLSHQMFKTDQYPLFDIRLSMMNEEESRLHVSLDLLIGDALSWYTLFNEMGSLIQTPEIKLPELELSFRDYVMSEKRLVATQEYEKSRTYWTKRLANFFPPPQLPDCKSFRLLKEARFQRYASSMDIVRWQRVKDIGAKRGVTPSVILLTAFSEVLSRWSKNNRFTLNLSLFNRLPLHPQVNQIIGDFTSISLLEVDMSGEKAFVANINSIQEQLWNDLDHRYFSGIRVLREIAKDSDDASRAVAPIVFTSTITQTKEALDASVVRKLGRIEYGVSQTPQIFFDHSVYEDDGTLFYHWDVIDDLFPAGMIRDMFEAYTGLLDRIAGEPGIWDKPVGDIIPGHQLEVVNRKNETDSIVAERQLHADIDDKVALLADNLAVIAPDCRLSYRRMSWIANRIARWLAAQGIGPNQLAAIVMKKGWEQIVAALGIVRSGAAYLPVDPELPRERIHYMLRNSDVQCIITQKELADTFPWPADMNIFYVDEAAAIPEEESNERVYGSAADLAYIIYTSGSTGTPKGVALEHRSVLNTILDINQRFGINEHDKIFAISSLSFDLSVYDIFGVLAAGGSIVLPDSGAAKDPGHWLDVLHHEEVTIWNSVPALMDLMVEYAIGNGKRLPDSLRLVLLSGDWIPTKLPGLIRSIAHPDILIISLGGATEASIWSILYPIEAVEPAWNSIPYGHGMKNQKFYVLDESYRQRPIWVEGDLYIGGIGLAREYWRDTARTQESFFIHPQTGERLYKTGDRGRYLPSGEIEFLGRVDSQVKIHGYRIELGEIEAAIKKEENVRDAIVTVRPDSQNRPLLVGYVLAGQQHNLVEDGLRQSLKKHLPDYMVPAYFVILQAWPFTANGKVDMNALPAPGLHQIDKSPENDDGGGPLQSEILEIVRAVTKQDDITARTNLIRLGITSIDVIRIANQLEKRFGMRLQFNEFYKEPMVESIACSFHQMQEVNNLEIIGDDSEDWEEGEL